MEALALVISSVCCVISVLCAISINRTHSNRFFDKFEDGVEWMFNKLGM